MADFYCLKTCESYLGLYQILFLDISLDLSNKDSIMVCRSFVCCYNNCLFERAGSCEVLTYCTKKLQLSRSVLFPLPWCFFHLQVKLLWLKFARFRSSARLNHRNPRQDHRVEQTYCSGYRQYPWLHFQNCFLLQGSFVHICSFFYLVTLKSSSQQSNCLQQPVLLACGFQPKTLDFWWFWYAYFS